jgi:MshEN domain
MFERRRAMQMEENAATAAEEQAWAIPDVGTGQVPEWPTAPNVPAGRLRPPLAALLADEGFASKEQLEAALAEGQASGERLGEVVLRHGWVNEAQLGGLLARQWDLPFAALSTIEVDESARALMTPGDSTRLGACPIGFKAGIPLVAVADPNEERFTAVRDQLGTECAFLVTTPTAMVQLIGNDGSAAVQPEALGTPEPALGAVQPEALRAPEPTLGAVQPTPEPALDAVSPTAEPALVPVQPKPTLDEVAEDSPPDLEQLDRLLERLLDERQQAKDELVASQQQLAALDEERAGLAESIRTLETKLGRDDRLLDAMRTKLTDFSQSLYAG